MAGQLSLFKGKRQRGVRPPAASEFATHCVIADMVRTTKLNPGWRWWHTPNGGERSARIIKGKRVSLEGGRLKRMGVDPGVPDFLLCGPGAVLHGFELKRRGEHPTVEQAAWGMWLQSIGGVWEWGDSVDAAIACFQKWGALPTRIRPQ